MSNYWLNFIIVFVCTSTADACWTMYIIKAAEKKAIAASFWGAAITALSGITILFYIEDPTLIIASISGAFIGTYLTIKWQNKNENNKDKN